MRVIKENSLRSLKCSPFKLYVRINKVHGKEKNTTTTTEYKTNSYACGSWTAGQVDFLSFFFKQHLVVSRATSQWEESISALDRTWLREPRTASSQNMETDEKRKLNSFIKLTTLDAVTICKYTKTQSSSAFFGFFLLFFLFICLVFPGFSCSVSLFFKCKNKDLNLNTFWTLTLARTACYPGRRL